MDRNTSIDNLTQGVFKSLSARRAWIEILFGRCYTWIVGVALRKESVDRNFVLMLNCMIGPVALRKESVDRNNDTTQKRKINPGRSPQGERG